MGQSWSLINIDKRQKKDIGDLEDPGLFSSYPSSSSFVDKFRRWPQADAFLSNARAREVNIDVRFPAMSCTEIGPFATLPTEIIHAIYLHIDHIYDLAILSITCQTLWEIGLEYLNRWFATTTAIFSWAGDRVLCAGHFLSLEEMHEGVLNSREQMELAAELETFCESVSYDPSRFLFPPTRPLTGLPLHQLPFDPIPPAPVDGLPLTIAQILSARGLQDDIDCNLILRRLANPEVYNHSPKDHAGQSGILRNLSRHHYFQESALRVWKDKHARRSMERVNLGDIIIMRICLTRENDLQPPIPQGIWAGDRFDIVENMGWLTECADDEPSWTDVTDEVMKEFEKIWCLEYRRSTIFLRYDPDEDNGIFRNLLKYDDLDTA
ncbi:hypothetical protein DFH06DRAFT_1474828 [Mycena polygramma]|nr:hypothetical protein DFH06DRAFT_1474828 [Mycena polygramma]